MAWPKYASDKSIQLFMGCVLVFEHDAAKAGAGGMWAELAGKRSAGSCHSRFIRNTVDIYCLSAGAAVAVR